MGVCYNEIGSYRCECRSGYRGDGVNSCEDVDECDEDIDECEHLCENNIGGYSCSCYDGFQLGPGGLDCNDIDECSLNLDCCVQECINLVPDENDASGYTCNCTQGFELEDDGCGCIASVDCTNLECINGVCYNDGNDDVCRCNSGYKEHNDTYCEDINECDEGIHKCEQNCINTPGSYNCTCADGYHLNSDQRSCRDVNECLDDDLNDCTELEVCNNLVGSYECICLAGYERNGIDCEDINECDDDDLNVCDKYADCENTAGSYRCNCQEGFVGDGFFCEDDDECSRPDSCPDKSQCTNYFGSYECSCNAGYQRNGDLCENIDECETGSSDCDEDNAECEDTVGSYVCTCNDGYTGDGRTCLDIDECRSGEPVCHDDAFCTNTDGSYYCICNIGYDGDGSTCTDIDECQNGDNECVDDSTCTNLPGSYQCTCNDGFRGDPVVACNDIDECAENTNDCHDDADCVNVPGTYECHCRPGYQGDGRHCEDVDECSTGEDTCHEQANCTNTEGSYTCQCWEGFYDPEGNERTGRNCTDIDECLTGGNDCDPVGGLCTNTFGSYRCDCLPGYRGDGRNCTDINECTEGDPCAQEPNTRCLNQPGSYICECATNYAIKDGSCTLCGTFNSTVVYVGGEGARVWIYDEDLSDPSKWEYHDNKDKIEKEMNVVFGSSDIADEYINSVVLQFFDYGGDVLSMILVNVNATSGLNDSAITDAFNRAVPANGLLLVHQYVVVRDSFTTEDPVHRCIEGIDLCDSNATCTDLPGGLYQCRCFDGFDDLGQGSEGDCVDIDECEENVCGDDVLVICTNYPGSYTCDCPAGYHPVGQVNETRCEVSKITQGKFRIVEIDGEVPDYYEDGYDNPESENYQNTEREIVYAMDIVYGDHDITGHYYISTEVLNFEAGSIISNYILIFSENATIDEEELTEILISSVEDGALANSSLVIQEESLEYIEFKACENDDYNDCHENAQCIDEADGQFTCKCYDGYQDMEESLFPGRNCTIAPPAENRNVAFLISIAGILLIFMVGVVTTCCICRRRRRKKEKRNEGNGKGKRNAGDKKRERNAGDEKGKRREAYESRSKAERQSYYDEIYETESSMAYPHGSSIYWYDSIYPENQHNYYYIDDTELDAFGVSNHYESLDIWQRHGEHNYMDLLSNRMT
ncbi:fibrillin-2-like [Ptychodera flava]|uniref:fibrillin-2-like n=1 Tax=Ptychodera flava TaxID=63121 RepID=UPI003969D437